MSLHITKAGLADIFLDSGRRGYQHLGVNPTGPMDSFSAQLANALLGKEVGGPTLELTFPASEISFGKPTVICLSGADFSPTLNGWSIALNQPVFVPAGSNLRFEKWIAGRWCYLAILHNLELESWLDSYSTHTQLGIGGYKGQSLKKGDEICFSNQIGFSPSLCNEAKQMDWKASREFIDEKDTVCFIKGPEWHWLNDESQELIQANAFSISHQSNRMGYRLYGTPLTTKESHQLVSSAVCAGTIQLLLNGQLIILMAHHQTTGGYPRLGNIASADLPMIAQLQPCQLLNLKVIDINEAERKKVTQQKYLQQLKNACTFKMQNIVNAAF